MMTARTTAVRGVLVHRWATWAVLAAAVLALLGAIALRSGPLAHAKDGGYTVPQNSAMEAKLGVRFTRAAVVADGGIVELRYTVLDAQKASKFQSDTHHPPVLRSESRGGDVYRAALMKQGHELRPGQTYYILYLNNHRSVRSGEDLTIDAGGSHLAHVPVK
jgi:hypothetical protein